MGVVLVEDKVRIKRKFDKNFPQIIDIARGSKSEISFKENLRNYIIANIESDETDLQKRDIGFDLISMIENEGKEFRDLSTGRAINIETFSLLWQFLSRRDWSGVSSDFLYDMFYIFRNFYNPIESVRDRAYLKRIMGRWRSGLEPNIVKVRSENKERIIELLIRKIEKRKVDSIEVRYRFGEGMAWEDKYAQVKEWWKSSRFHLTMAIKSPGELNLFLGNTLSKENMETLNRAKRKGIPFFITPYYLHLLDISGNYDDQTVREYIIYSKELVDTYGNIVAWEKEDKIREGAPNTAGWLLPRGHNIHRRYPEVAILIPDTLGRTCGGLCASCQRMYDFQSERLGFDFENLLPKENWGNKLKRLMKYFEEDTQLRDILITGGDALMSTNASLRKILEAVYQMALDKKRANKDRSDGEKYAEIVRVRLGSRLLAYLPMRIDQELIDILKEFKLKASSIGVSQFFIQTHFQSPLELTPDAKNAIDMIRSSGWTITNQLVYNVAASRRGHTAKLRKVLNSVGILCYYTFTVKGFNENYAVYTPNSRSVQEQVEEKVFGKIDNQQRQELNMSGNIGEFLKKHDLPFVSTDRNVLNLPGIGKSMTFKTVGITREGNRILEFDHDKTRRHSPIIDKIGKVYIVENKSIAAYLRQLELMGEDIKEYSSIWRYTRGVTEPRFYIYDYPRYNFIQTDYMSNLCL